MINRKRQVAPFDITTFPIYRFLTTEDVTVTIQDAIDVIQSHRDEPHTLMVLDPPYISTCNDFYSADRNINIYEWLYRNNIDDIMARVILILENIWINRLLFEKNNMHTPYTKLYQYSKKKSEHIIITQS